MTAIVLGLALATVIQSQTAPGGSIAFEHVAVVVADSGRIRPDQTVLVRGDRIIVVGPASSVAIPPGTIRIHGRGRFLLPGLVDIHVHVTARDFPLFLFNGVTAVREMNGSPAHLAWRDSLARGEIAGPSLVVTSPLLAGVAQRYRHELVATPADAVAAVKRAAALGYDVIKVYDGLSLEAYQALTSEARRVGLSLTGHVPQAVGLAGLSDLQRSVEHTQEILRGLNAHQADSAGIAGAVQRLRGRGIHVTPTLAVFGRLTLSASPEVQALFQRPEMAYVDSSIAGWWGSFRRSPPSQPSTRALALAEAHRRVVRELIAQEIPILVGTDTPNPFMVPGFSLHDELDALGRMGLAPSTLIRLATIEAARFLGAESEFGRVAPGLRADLVLVEGNPLDDLSILRSPQGVMVRGRWYSGVQLKEGLSHVRRKS